MAHDWRPAPDLPPGHAEALAEAQRLLDDRTDLQCVLLCGSVVRGEGGATSDLDLYCLVAAPVRQRRHLVARSGVLVEIFLNPAAQVRRYMTNELTRRRPSTAHMLATGHALLDRAPATLTALRTEAAAMLAAGPAPLEGAERALRIYGVRDTYDDAVDAAATALAHPGSMAAAFAQCLSAAVSLHYALQRRWEPKAKRVDQDLRRWDPAGAHLLAAYAAADTLDMLGAFVAHVLAEEGGLPVRSWDGPEEPVAEA